MADPSPAAGAFLRILRVACVLCAGVVVLIMAIEVWKTWFIGVPRQLVPADYVFLAILVALLVGLLWLARAITRELRRSSGT